MPLTPKDRGYIAGVCDARKGRTPEHSHSSYRFPLMGSYLEQKEYNEGYYEGKAKEPRAAICEHDNVDEYLDLCDDCGAPVKLPEPTL